MSDAPVLSDGHVDWRALCEAHNIQPRQREVFELWIVTDWLADRLLVKGEKVERGVAGLTIWARTRASAECSLSADPVIVAIADAERDRGLTDAAADAELDRAERIFDAQLAAHGKRDALRAVLALAHARPGR